MSQDLEEKCKTNTSRKGVISLVNYDVISVSWKGISSFNEIGAMERIRLDEAYKGYRICLVDVRSGDPPREA